MSTINTIRTLAERPFDDELAWWTLCDALDQFPEADRETILRPTGRRLDAERPYVDGRLPDGSPYSTISN